MDYDAVLNAKQTTEIETSLCGHDESNTIETFLCKVCNTKKCSLNKETSSICESCREEITREENLKTIRVILGKSNESEQSSSRVVRKINQKFLNPNFKSDIKFHRLQHELTLEMISIILNTFEFMKGYEGPNGEGISELLQYYGLGKEHVEGIRDFLSDREAQATDRVMVADFFSKKKSKRPWIYTIFDIKEDEECEEDFAGVPEKKQKKADPYERIENKICQMKDLGSYESNKEDIFGEVICELDSEIDTDKYRYLSQSSNTDAYKGYFKSLIKAIHENNNQEIKNILKEMSNSPLLCPETFPDVTISWLSKIIDEF